MRNTERALKEFEVKSISLVGGVAANSELRKSISILAEKYEKNIVIPDMQFCGDNAAMIAYRGLKVYEAGERFDLSYSPYPGLHEEHFIHINS